MEDIDMIIEELTLKIQKSKLNRLGITTISSFLPSTFFELLQYEIINNPHWEEECWSIDSHENVCKVGAEQFSNSAEINQFSRNFTLPDKQMEKMLTVVQFSKIISSPQFINSISQKTGLLNLAFKSLDTARYSTGHFLTRHADIFDNRVLGAVLFLNTKDNFEFGGDLVIENPFCEKLEIKPEANMIVFFPIQSGYWHWVARNKSPTWERFSMATHFSTTSTISSH